MMLTQIVPRKRKTAGDEVRFREAVAREFELLAAAGAPVADGTLRSGLSE